MLQTPNRLHSLEVPHALEGDVVAWAAPDVVVGFDHRLRIVYVNPAAEDRHSDCPPTSSSDRRLPTWWNVA